MIDRRTSASHSLVPDAKPLWSTPKFLLVAVLVEFVTYFVLNGVLNEVLHLGVPPAAIGVAPTLLLIALLPRWSYFARLRAKQ